MDIINYFAERQYVKKLLNDFEMDIKKVCWYCKNCKKCEQFYSIKSEFKKKVFRHIINILDIGILEIQNFMKEIEILKLDLLGIQNLECKIINSLIMISRRALELFLH